MPSTKTYLFSSVGMIFLMFFFWWFLPEEPLLSVNEKWKGVCWVGSRQPLQGGEISALKSTGANAISQTPFGWQADKNSPEIRWDMSNERRWWGETPMGIQVTLDSSSQQGIMNMLKPHLWVREGWVGEIEMKNESDWNTWFSNYQAFILDYAKLAEELKMPMLCIGTELEKTSSKEKEWRKIIAEVRKVYSGKITYAANFTEFEQVKFWDALDYIGVQAYFPLAKDHNPKLEELISSWNSHIPQVEKVVRKYKKPVLFTEIGYCNTVDAAIQPWVWPNERREMEFSEDVQAICYEAFFQTAWKKDWLAGVFFWKWYPERHTREPDFTPQGKRAEKVMASYFLLD
ncbi:hypothetical protein DFQ04_0167 [Algoriphagus boseongensis]|uniref:GTA TIM-barrel-like domain-containing protein n=1 Tax=Algoriphagus boseongensis TaxID=1442587 RepID=A0A4R6T5J9_9BACT|nr:hypothetical protein [Algoriphagus boseongensis]TDQ18368.1 hypothetical protein DFQ04_0167 [Algoriphagus boseongensis]